MGWLKKYQSGGKKLQSGVVVDKEKNMAKIYQNFAPVDSFPVITGKNSLKNTPNLVTDPEIGYQPRNTPVGQYIMQPGKVYGKPGYHLVNPKLANIAWLHTTYDPANRAAAYNKSDPRARDLSYGCVNCRDEDIAKIYKHFPQGDTLQVLPRNVQQKKKEPYIFGSPEPSGLYKDEELNYQNGGYSTTGYKADSPDRNNPYNIIPSGRITMQNVPHPVLGIDNFGNKQMMQPGGEYQFQGDRVFEVPAMQGGGVAPIYVDNINDPRLQAYNDSLTLHKAFKGDVDKLKSMTSDEWWNHTKETYKSPLTKKALSAAKRLELLNKERVKPSITYGDLNNNYAEEFTAPVQPYLFRKNLQINQLNGDNRQSQPYQPQQVQVSPYIPTIRPEGWYSNKVGVPIDAEDVSALYNEDGTPKYIQEMKEGGIPQRYKNMGFSRVGQKKSGDGQHKWKVLAKKGDSYKVVQGGYRGMQDFKQHHSEERKDRFWDRMGGRDSSKAKDPFSPLYWHKRFGTWEYGGVVPSSEMYKDGGMIKRADGSYSKRGLWDNIRANAGSGKKPTKEMLQQEKKIRSAEKKEYNGWLNSYQEGGQIGYTNLVNQPIARTVSQNPTTPGKLDPQEQAAIQRRLYELQNSQQMYQRPTDYRTPAEKQYYEQKRITELEKEGLTPEGFPTGRTKVNKTLDPVAGLIEKGIDASVVYDAGLLGAKGLRALAKKVGSKISIPRGYTGPMMTDLVPIEPVYPTSPYRPPGGRTFPVLPARTPTGMPTLVDVPELTKEQQILQSFGLDPYKTLIKNPEYMSLEAPKGNMYGQNQVLIQQSRLLNPKTKAKFFEHQAPVSGPKESILQKMPADYSNRITPENYEDFINRVHSSTDYDFASAPKTGANLGIGSYGRPGMVYKNAPLNNLGKDIINAHEKNHGIFAGTLSKEMNEDLLKPFGTSKPIPHYSGKHQPDEVLARMAQFKNAVGIGDNQTFTLGHLNLIRKNYPKQFLDNGITEMLEKIKPGTKTEKEFLKNMNKYAFGTTGIGAGVAASQGDNQKYGGWLKKYK